MKENKYNSVLKATSLFGGVQILNVLLNMLRTKAVAVLLGPSGVGLNGIYNETRELIHCTSNLGLDVSGVRGISQAYEKGSAVAIDREVTLLRSWVLLLSLLGVLVCMLLAAPLSLFTFGDYDHTWGYVMLSPAVAFSTMTCGEMAVLKGLRRLKSLASASVINVVAAIVVSLPLYYVWGIRGVLPALVLCCLSWMLVAMCFGYKAHPPRFCFGKGSLKAGNVMLGIGVTFVVCEVVSHLAGLTVQSYLNNNASLHMVGLYNACRTMTLTYAGMVFSAMEQDYFPRLTGVIGDAIKRVQVLMRQVDVTLIIITPLLVALIVALPLVIPLVLSGEFRAIIPMTQVVTAGLIFRAVYLPHAYLPLAAGHSKVYFALNLVGALNTFWIIAGYALGGLMGMGTAMFLENLADLLMVAVVTRVKYGVTLPRKTLRMMLTSTLLIAATYALSLLATGIAYWLLGAMLTAVSAYLSYNYYKS